MKEKISRKNIVHDFNNLPDYLISKCPKCENLYNNAEDRTCSKCDYKFYRKGFKPKGMTEKEIEVSSNNRVKKDNVIPEENLPIKENRSLDQEETKKELNISRLKKNINTLKENKVLYLIYLSFFVGSLVFFSYSAIYKLGSVIEERSVFANYYLLQLQFIKSFKAIYILLGIISLVLLYLYRRIFLKNKSFKEVAYSYAIIIIVSALGFNFGYLGMRFFALGDILIERWKINKNHQAEKVYWNHDEVIDKLKHQNDPPKILKEENNVTKQVLLLILDNRNRSYFYKQSVLPATLAFYSPKISIPDDSAYIMAENNLIFMGNELNTDALSKITPLLVKLMIKSETQQRYIKDEPEIYLMGRQEYNQFREDQINKKIAKIEEKLAIANKIVNSYYSAIANDKSAIADNEYMAFSSRSKGDSTYTSCILAEDCTYNYIPGTCSYYPYFYCSPGQSYRTCSPRYSTSYCASQRDFYYGLADGYDDIASSWRAQLRNDQYELGIFLKIKEIIENYREMAIASKEDIPLELGLFEAPNNIKMAIDSMKIETLADYFSTATHEYLHYTSYVSEESTLPLFFEEGLTEYFARKTIKDSMGIETNEGYPLIVKVIERMMQKIPENEFEEIYFKKDSASLASTLDNAFGKDFSKDNELYFEFISYIPPDKALDITNEFLKRIELEQLTKEDLFSKKSKF